MQLIIRGEIIDMSAIPDPGEPFAVEELAQGFDPRRISLVIEHLTETSPLVWLAAVEKRDCKILVEVKGRDQPESKTLQAVIVGQTIVPLRALFDSAHIAMTSGCCVDVSLLEDSGPIRVFRQVRRCRRILQ